MLGRHLISQVTFLAPVTYPLVGRVSLCTSGCLQTYPDPPASIFQALEIQAHATISSFHLIYAARLLTSVGCHYCKSDRFVIYLVYISTTTFMFSQIVGFLVHIFFLQNSTFLSLTVFECVFHKRSKYHELDITTSYFSAFIF